MRKDLLTILIIILFAPCMSLHICAQDSVVVVKKQEISREYTKEHPLVFEDAFDIWPYAFNDDKGKALGFNVELVDLLLKELGIPHVTKLKVRKDVLNDLENRRADLTLGMHAPFNEEYTFFGDQVVSLFTHSVVWPKNETQPIKNFEDIKNHQVFVHQGSFSHYLIIKEGWNKNARAVEDMESAVKKIAIEGKGELIWNTAALKWLIHANHLDNLQMAPINMPDGEYKFMSNDRQLLHQLDSVYSKLRNDVRVTKLRNKWFYPEKQNSGVPSWIWHILNLLVVLTFFLSSIFIYARYREKRAIKRSTMRNSRLALIMRVSGLSIWLYDPINRTFIWIDHEGIPTHTYTFEQFTSRLDKADHDLVISTLDDIANNKNNFVTIDIHTYAESNPTGGFRTYSVTLSVLREKDGKPTRIMAVCDDVTEKQKKLRETKERLIRYRSVFSTAVLDMIYFDSDGNIANMNENAQETFQISLDETIKKKVNLEQIIGIPDFNKNDFDFYHATRLINFNVEEDKAIFPNLQKPIIYELQVVPVKDDNGKFLCAYATGHDITEIVETYHNVQEGIKREKLAYEEITDYINNINYVMDVGGVRIATYSPSTHLMSIYSTHNTVKHKLTQTRVMSLISEQYNKTVLRAINNMDNLTKSTIDAEVRTTLRIGGKPLFIHVRMMPVFDTDGNVTSYFGMCRDISDIKETEAELEKETIRAHEIETLKNSFLKNMSYEIRTPLNTVVGFAELFEQEHSPEDETLFINEIKANSAHLLDLINDILFLSRLDAHMIEYEIQPTDFALTFEGHCNIGWSGKQKENIDYLIENHYEKLIVNIDDANLGKIIAQVVSNAAEHTETGFVRARYDYVGDKLMIAVEDTGPGIPPHIMEHIYERFTTGNSRGTGLGLPICKELIEQMGGKIEISTMESRGTTVWITLPCEATTIDRKKRI